MVGEQSVESRGGRELFGLDRFTRIVEQHATCSVAELRDRLLDAALAWGGAEVEDDMTVMVLRHVDP